MVNATLEYNNSIVKLQEIKFMIKNFSKQLKYSDSLQLRLKITSNISVYVFFKLFLHVKNKIKLFIGYWTNLKQFKMLVIEIWSALIRIYETVFNCELK